MQRKDIIITNLDKVGIVVIMDGEKYTSKANRQLSDKRSFKTLQHYCVMVVNDTIDRFEKENLLFKKLADGQKLFNRKTPKF